MVKVKIYIFKHTFKYKNVLKLKNLIFADKSMQAYIRSACKVKEIYIIFKTIDSVWHPEYESLLRHIISGMHFLLHAHIPQCRE